MNNKLETSESSMSADAFHFAFAADEKFTVQLQVAVLSLIKASAGLTSVQHIHVLDCGISDNSWENVVSRATTLAKKNFVSLEIQRHSINMSLFNRFREWNTSKAAYARLLLPLLLPDVRYCVYSDCDVLFICNPWNLVVQLKNAKVAILGHKNSIDRGLTNPDERWFAKVNEPYNRSTYFCSGLIAIDLNKLREHGALDSMFDFLVRHPDAVTADQSALNWYFRNDSALDNGGWGVFPIECFGDNFEIKAIHYAGGTPWKTCDSWYKYLMYKQQDELWLDFAKQMLGRDVIKRQTLLSSQVLGCVAFLVTYLILKLHLPLPNKREYMNLFYDRLYKHSAFDRARRKLMAEMQVGLNSIGGT